MSLLRHGVSLLGHGLALAVTQALRLRIADRRDFIEPPGGYGVPRADWRPCMVWALLLIALNAFAQPPQSPVIKGLRSDTGLSVEQVLIDHPEQAREQIVAALLTGEGATPGRRRGLLLLLRGKLALVDEEVDLASQYFAEAESMLATHGVPRDLSRLRLQQLHVLTRKRVSRSDFAAGMNQALTQSRAAGDDWAIVNIYLLQGFAAAQSSDYATAREAAEQGLALAKRLPDHRVTALLLNNLANARKNLGMMGGALDAHFQALALRRESGTEDQIIQSLSNIVLVYQRMEDWPEARRYSEEALLRSKQASRWDERTRIALNHASLLVRTNQEPDVREALQLLDTLRADVAAQFPQWRYSLLDTEARALTRLQRQEEALGAAKQAVAMARTAAESELVECLQTLAIVQMAQVPPLAEAAEQTLREAIPLAEHVQLAGLENDLRQHLAMVLEHQGRLAEALHEWKRHQELNRRVQGLEQVRRIAKLEQQVAIADRERELQTMRTRDLIQQDQISRQRWLGGMGIVTLIAVALAFYSRFRYAQKRAHAVELAREALSQQNELLEKLASTDSLTGLRNRQWMHKTLEAQSLLPPSCSSSLAILDIDHFKTINDSYGHDVGDAVLIGIAALMQRRLPEQAACARWGGEEFIIHLQQDLAASMVTLNGLREDLAALHDWPVAMTVTCSIGVAERVSGEASVAWLKRADLALYEAKHGGRNRVCAAISDLGPSTGA